MHSCTFNIFKGVDGQVFSDLAAGTYTIFVEATATDNTNEVVYDTVGPVLLAVGANASISEAIGKYSYCLLATLRLAAFCYFRHVAACFGRQEIRCDSATNVCQYVATWRTRGDRVEFNLVAQTQGWVGIGFSTDRIMVRFSVNVTTCTMINTVLDLCVAKK